MDGLNRRRFLQAAGVSVAISAAGCVDLGGSDSLAETDWVPADTAALTFGYIDFDVTEQVQEDDSAFQSLDVFYPSAIEEQGSRRRVRVVGESFDSREDPMLALPIQTGGALIAGAVIGLSIPGLGYLVDPTGESGVDELITVGGVAVAIGAVDRDEAEKHLQRGGGSRFGPPYEQTDQHNGFAVYEPVEAVGNDAPGAAAVSSSAALVAETRSGADTVIETANGDHERAVDDGRQFDWLTDAVGDGDLGAGWCGSVELDDLHLEDSGEGTVDDVFSSDDDVLSAVTFLPEDDELTVDVAVRNDDLRQRKEGLEAALGTAAADETLTVEDGRLTATGTYEGISFERVDPPGDGNGGGEDELPDAVADAVPDDAFTFEYDETEKAVRVEIVEGFEADEVTVESVNTEFEASIDRTNSGTWLNVLVDPDGDTVRVIVTVDDARGVVATRDVP